MGSKRQQSSNFNTTIHYFFMLLLFFGSLFSFVSIYFYTEKINSFENKKALIMTKEILNNWEKKMINDVKVNQVNFCPDGYENLYSQRWAGIDEGCQCQSNLKISNVNTLLELINGEEQILISKGICTEQQQKESCEIIPFKNSKQFYFWKDGNHFCVKRSRKSFFSTPADCKLVQNYYGCGSGQNFVCVPNNELCPISSIVFDTFSSKSGFTKVKGMNGTMNLFIQRMDQDEEQHNYPIQGKIIISKLSYTYLEFKINEHDFCELYEHQNISPDKGEYLLSLKYRQICKDLSGHFEIVSSIGEKELFKQNQLYSIVRSIPAYPIPSNDYQWNLGFRRAFNWSLNCRKTQEWSLEEAKVQFILDIDKSYQTGLFIAAVVNFLYGGLFLPFAFARQRCTYENQIVPIDALTPQERKGQRRANRNLRREQRRCFKFITFYVDMFLKCIFFALIAMVFYFSKKSEEFYGGIVQKECMGNDISFNSYWLDYSDLQLELKGIILYRIGFPVVLILFADALYIQLRQGVKKRKRKKNKKGKATKGDGDEENQKQGQKAQSLSEDCKDNLMKGNSLSDEQESQFEQELDLQVQDMQQSGIIIDQDTKGKVIIDEGDKSSDDNKIVDRKAKDKEQSLKIQKLDD